MSQSFVKTNNAPNDATYITQTSNPNLTSEQSLSSLSTGFMKSTTGTGVVTSQANPIPVTDGGTGATTLTANGILLGQGTSAIVATTAGTTGQILHGNTGADPSYSAISLTADVTGVLPIANGGTNNSTAYTAGSVIFSDGTKLTQNNSKLFWDDTNNLLLLGNTSSATSNTVLDATGATEFNKQTTGASSNFVIKGVSSSSLFVADYTNNSVEIGTNTQGDIAKFNATEITFNPNNRNQDWRYATSTDANLFFVDASADQIGILTNAPHSTLDNRGGLGCNFVTKTASYTITASDFYILGNPGAGTSITITLQSASSAGAGRIVSIKKQNLSITDTVTIARAGSDTIDGATSITLTAQFSSRTLISDGTSVWSVISTT